MNNDIINQIDDLPNFMDLQENLILEYGYPYFKEIESFSNIFKILTLKNDPLQVEELDSNDLLIAKYIPNTILYHTQNPTHLLKSKNIEFDFIEKEEDEFQPTSYSKPTVFYYPKLNKYFIFGLEQNEVTKYDNLDKDFDYINWLKENNFEYFNEDNHKVFLTMLIIPQKISHIDYDGFIGISRDIYRYYRGDDSTFDLSNIAKVFDYQISNNISDLHINSGEKHYTVKIRQFGKIKRIGTIQTNTAKNFITKIKSDANDDEFDQTKETKRIAKHVSNGEERRFRISISPTINWMKVVFRLIPNKISDLDELNMPQPIYERLSLLLDKTYGLQKASKAVAICGPTGTGKSATASTIVKAAAENGRLVTEIGNPIEMIQENENITQVDLSDSENADENIRNTMEKAARATKRQDQDILYITELQTDNEKIEALRLGAQGHGLIFSMHTSSVYETLEDLSEAVKQPINRVVYKVGHILLQRLIPRKCTKCNGEGKIGTKTCHICQGAGEYDRVPIVEYWEAKKLKKEEHYPDIIDSKNYASKQVCEFYYTFEDSLENHFKNGKITEKTYNEYQRK